MRGIRGARHRDDLPGADDRAQPALHGRQPDRRGARAARGARRERGARARRSSCSQRTGIPEPARRVDAYPHQLSGGQRQRAMIAMALACRPQAADRRRADDRARRDDPGADPRAARRAAGARCGMALLFITHDLNLVRRFTHRVGVMERGKLVETGRRPATVFAHPRIRTRSQLLASRPQRVGAAGRRRRAGARRRARRRRRASQLAQRLVREASASTRCATRRSRCAAARRSASSASRDRARRRSAWRCSRCSRSPRARSTLDGERIDDADRAHAARDAAPHAGRVPGPVRARSARA